MSSFEYVSVLLSIVLALGVAHILGGTARLPERCDGPRLPMGERKRKAKLADDYST